jgi:C_GCAxxG_C_C family probable redox protein
MNNTEYALDCLKNGCSCAQSVLSAFIDQFNLDKALALRISSAFGGGMGGQGEICGAVSAAFMVLGLNYGSPVRHDDEEKERIGRKAGEFMKKFKARKGSILCRELLGADIGTPEGLETAKTKGLFEISCPDIIRCSVETLEEILAEQ